MKLKIKAAVTLEKLLNPRVCKLWQTLSEEETALKAAECESYFSTLSFFDLCKFHLRKEK